MSLNVIEEKPISPAQVRDILEKANEKGELNFKSLKLFEYLNRTVTLKLEESDALVKELSDLGIIRLTDTIIMKIAEILPINKDILRNLLSSMNTTLSDEDVEKIMDVLKLYNTQ
ncbi:MAG: hypothetical protein PHT94_03825 [Candidatus Nanoarchaeia archaeon]|nr:hypothetical protein [Candidatus Nanoarchaeia archaeon]